MATCACGREFESKGKWGIRRFCSRSCANKRTHSEETKEKISASIKMRHTSGSSYKNRKLGWSLPPRTVEHCKQISENQRKYWEGKKRTAVEKAARNKANVYAYRARKNKAIPLDADRNLIRLIYEHCPDGYEVDHIIAIAVGGKHHQDNLQYLPRRENRVKGCNRKYDVSKAIKWQSIVAAQYVSED